MKSSSGPAGPSANSTRTADCLPPSGGGRNRLSISGTTSRAASISGCIQAGGPVVTA